MSGQDDGGQGRTHTCARAPCLLGAWPAAAAPGHHLHSTAMQHADTPPPAPHRTPRGSGLGRQASSGGGGAVGACVDAMPPWPVQRAVQWGPWTDLGAMGSCIPGDPWSPGGKLTPPAAAALCTSRLQQQNCPCSAKHAPTIFGRPSRQTAPGTRGSSRAGLPLGSCTYLGTSATMRVTPPAPPDAHAPPGSGRARASHPAGGGGGGVSVKPAPPLQRRARGRSARPNYHRHWFGSARLRGITDL